jgi:hypothetical protein
MKQAAKFNCLLGLFSIPEDGSDMFLVNVGQLLPNYSYIFYLRRETSLEPVLP